MGFYKILTSSYRLTNIFSSKNIKKIILFILIGLLLFLVFSNNSFAAENVTVDVLYNASVSNNVIVSSDVNDVFYFKTLKGAIYHLTLDSLSNRTIYSSDSIDVGSSVSAVTTISNGQTYDFVGTGDVFLLWSNGDSYGNVFSISVDYNGNYDGTVSNLTNTFSLGNMWNQLGFAVPIIGLAVLFGLGYMIIRRSSKGVSKSKVKF